MKKALVLGAGGFIGSHLVKRLKKNGYWVRGVDLKLPEFSDTDTDDFVLGDLCDYSIIKKVIYQPFDEAFRLAADMGGAGNQTRSFLYIDECLDGVLKLMDSDFSGSVNIGSDEMVTIN